MATPSLAREPFKRLLQIYERVQVELHGKYSLERLFCLHGYQHTYTFWSCLLIAVITPLPCLAIIVVTDLIPLHPPSDGLSKSHVFWVRAFVVVLLITLALLEQSRRFVPGLPCSTPFLLTMSGLIALGAVVGTIGLASQVGFPLPFTLISGTPMWCICYIIFIVAKWGRLLLESRSLRYQWLTYHKLVTVQMSLTLVYPAFIFVFIRLRGWEQTAFALLLPLMKLIAKNALSACFNSQLEDLKPEGVIFNVEVFHALYMSCCMQSSNSIITTGLLMMLDFLHAWSSMKDINHLMSNIQRLEAKFINTTQKEGEMSEPASDGLSLIEKAMYYAHCDAALRRNSAIRVVSSGPAPGGPLAAVVPTVTSREVSESIVYKTPSIPAVAFLGQNLMTSEPTRRRTETATLFGELSRGKRRSLDLLTDHERLLYVSSLLQVLHIVEFILLIEFVEVIIPVVYCVYLTAMFHLPNRLYYPQLANMDTHSLLSTVKNVFIYASLEFLSFLVLCIALHRKLEISPLHQLAFVLHSQWGLVQSKMVLWVVFAVQVSLAHSGYDYSFQFAWLKAKP